MMLLFQGTTKKACNMSYGISPSKFIKGLKTEEFRSESAAGRSKVGHLTADGRFVISGNYKGSLEAWNIETGEVNITFSGHEDDVIQYLLYLKENFFQEAMTKRSNYGI
jgi:hypothetical protein